jgi:hypothetical protein
VNKLVQVDEGDLFSLLAELRHSRQQIPQLQADGTRLINLYRGEKRLAQALSNTAEILLKDLHAALEENQSLQLDVLRWRKRADARAKSLRSDRAKARRR